MSTPYIGEIRMFAGTFAPVGWAFCDGSLIPISQNDTLYALLGTTYGGDGLSTFALPDLRGRVPIHQGQGPGLSARTIGERAGTESVTLTTTQLPSHTHAVVAALVPATTGSPAGATWAATSAPSYTTGSTTNTMSPAALAPAGGSQPHENRVPSLGVSFIIATEGIFPSQA
ncbi:phage tail protein [Cellulomonas alba]|uniref:Tail fiber protein n=1 Tax=Cellulomonas alba TaxID=3053467 RepID=A0ABT7SIU5_9CELL|nr:tail fiber protein [Cellulomonas alba]MDM7855482.1 tail fiber protein [Cellulomonas alba]